MWSLVLSSDRMEGRSVSGPRATLPWENKYWPHVLLFVFHHETLLKVLMPWKNHKEKVLLPHTPFWWLRARRSRPPLPAGDVTPQRVHLGWISRPSILLSARPQGAKARMALVQTLVEFRSIGWFSACQLIASLFFVFVIYKLAILLVRKRASQRHFELFPGPRAHWLFGHVLEVLGMQLRSSSLRFWRGWAALRQCTRFWLDLRQQNK